METEQQKGELEREAGRAWPLPYWGCLGVALLIFCVAVIVWYLA